MTRGARQIGMMSRRQIYRGLAVAAGWGLLGALVAGCGSVPASVGGGAPAGAAAAAAASAAAAPQVGCASVNQATMVTISGLGHPMVPASGLLVSTNRESGQVRALFRDFCDAVIHRYIPSGVVHCPADFGADYAGVFYDGNRVLARYTYSASGCRQVGITVGSTTQSTMVAGQAFAAAPRLAADWAAVLHAAKPTAPSPPSQVNPGPSQVNPGGPNKPA
jgi:hypothetical protein